MNPTATQTPALAIYRAPNTPVPQTIGRLPARTIARHHQPGADFAVVHRLGLNELHITIQPRPGDTIARMVWRLDTILCEYEATVARMEVFGAVAVRAEFLAAMRRLIGEAAWPIMWIDGAGFNGNAIAGLHVFAVVGLEVESIRVGGRIVGRVFSDSFADHCLLGDIIPTHTKASRADQAREVFENMQAALAVVGMRVNDIARTWFYLDHLLDWYGDLNRVRTSFFKQWGIFESGVPASTGIGAGNPHGAAMVGGAWATVPKNGEMKVRAVRSPLQCPADDYGSSFARAMEWDTPGNRRISVSGTASIALGGASVHKGEIDSQVDLTMDVIEAILVSRGLDFSDVNRATAYVKLPRHAGCLDDWFERHDLWFPAVTTHTDLCRDELLFEIELDAIMEKPPGRIS